MPPRRSRNVPENGALSQLLDLSIAADGDAIASVVDVVSEILTRMKVLEEKRFEVALAVQEALANAVVHGCGNDPSKQVRCQLLSDPDGRIVIIVTDPGPGFRPELVADPRHADNLHADHGRGVYLIRRLMDEVHFERGGNQIHMWKY